MVESMEFCGFVHRENRQGVVGGLENKHNI